jgi:hypothetical protein
VPRSSTSALLDTEVGLMKDRKGGRDQRMIYVSNCGKDARDVDFLWRDSHYGSTLISMPSESSTTLLWLIWLLSLLNKSLFLKKYVSCNLKNVIVKTQRHAFVELCLVFSNTFVLASIHIDLLSLTSPHGVSWTLLQCTVSIYYCTLGWGIR